MATIDNPDPATGKPLWQKLAWFVGLWLGGIAAVGLLAGILRKWLIG